MAYKLVCTIPFHGFNKGDQVTDPAEVEKHLAKRDHHFVKVWVPDAEPAPAPAPQDDHAD